MVIPSSLNIITCVWLLVVRLPQYMRRWASLQSVTPPYNQAPSQPPEKLCKGAFDFRFNSLAHTEHSPELQKMGEVAGSYLNLRESSRTLAVT